MIKDHLNRERPCKRVNTYNSYNHSNGWLLEVFSDQDEWTDNHFRGQVYLTVIAPHNHKGFHIHAKSIYHFVCLKGRVKSVIYSSKNIKQEIQMGDGDFKAIRINPGEAHCMINEYNEEVYMLTYRYPAWTADDPDILSISPKEIETDDAWDKIDHFNKLVKN